MSKTKKITLNEQQFIDKVRHAVRESIKRILKEGFADRGMSEKWAEAIDLMGAQRMLMEVYNYFDADQLEEFLRSIDNDWELDLFADDGVDDEEEEDNSWVNELV